MEMRYENFAFLNNLMKKEIEEGHISGSAIRILHHGEIIYDNEFGYADKEKGIPIKKDTIYRMYSMTKPITAVAAMILYERGLLNLFAPVSDYLDGFKNQKVLTPDGLVDVKREVTIQDLLNMTSGVVYPDAEFEAGRIMETLFGEEIECYNNGNPMDTIEFCNLIGRQPLEFHPGEKWRYGTSADILGAVIQVVSGKKLSIFLQEEIFTPLGMKDTDFYVPEEKFGRFAMIYEFLPELGKLVPCHWNHIALHDYKCPPAFESGGAGLVSTIDDYARFAKMLANGGDYEGKRILGTKTVEYMTKPQLTLEQLKTYDWDSTKGYSYGNLMRVLVDPALAASNGSIGEFGWDGWSGNYFMIDPKEDLVMVYMIQRCFGGRLSTLQAIRSIIYGAIR